jgi:hypothetical protein
LSYFGQLLKTKKTELGLVRRRLPNNACKLLIYWQTNPPHSEWMPSELPPSFTRSYEGVTRIVHHPS